MKKWRCTVCGYVHEGDAPPEQCPVCGAPQSAFEPVEETESASLSEAPTADSETDAGKGAANAGPPWLGKILQIDRKLQEGPIGRLWLTARSVITKQHLHPISTHIPNGALPLAVVFIALAIFTASSGLNAASAWNVFFVFLAMPFVMISGYVDWQERYDGAWLPVFRIKIICAIAVVVLTMIILGWRVISPEISSATAKFIFLLLHIGVLVAAGIAGHYGGKLVFKD